jgi:plastocyanin
MRNSIRLRALVGLVLALVLVAAACGSGDDSDTATAGNSDTTTTTATAEKAGGDEAYIEIKGFQFTVPKSVAAGAKVEIRNVDSATHTVTADDGSFDSKEISGGEEGSITAPSTPGTYMFHCNIHPSMKAELVVT